MSKPAASRERFRARAANPLWNPWANDARLLELYRRRCRREAEEMTCARQAADILGGLVTPGETLLDAGCGGGYYYWSLARTIPSLRYYGLDYTPAMIDLARTEMCPSAGLPRNRFIVDAIENLDRSFDTILCFNVLTNSPHYARPLERLLACARKRVLLRESLGAELVVRYSRDRDLDPDARIRVYHNVYPLHEVVELMEEEGFRVTPIADVRTADGVEIVCDLPHHWRILLAQRFAGG